MIRSFCSKDYHGDLPAFDLAVNEFVELAEKIGACPQPIIQVTDGAIVCVVNVLQASTGMGPRGQMVQEVTNLPRAAWDAKMKANAPRILG